MEQEFNNIVSKLENYVRTSGLQSLVLGLSGGIDSTVVGAIIYEVAQRTGVRIIGRSLPIKNGACEKDAADLTGRAFFGADYKVINLHDLYEKTFATVTESEIDMPEQTPIANGNLQARLRMIYLYNLASTNRGMVMDTDNRTEYYLGFYTLHGDVGDYKPIGHLWKTQVYELATWLCNVRYINDPAKKAAMQAAIDITPTDGLGISNSDLDQIGASSYQEVDLILQATVDRPTEEVDFDVLAKIYPAQTIQNVYSRYLGSMHKR